MEVVLAAEDLDEMNIEILRNTLYKAYLDDFAAFCNKLGGATAEVMGDLLAFEVQSVLLCFCAAHDTIMPLAFSSAFFVWQVQSGRGILASCLMLVL